MDVTSTADLLEELEDEAALDAIETLTPAQLADVLDEMEPDEAADLLGDLPPERVTETLAEMEEADEVIPLLGYPDESAGGLMTTSYIAMRRQTSTDQAIQFLRDVSAELEIPYYLYVVDRENKLAGVVSLREIVLAMPGTAINDIMQRDVIYVESTTDQEEAARVMSRYDLAALPVVDEQGKLVGVITYDDIVEVIEDEATEDIYRLASVSDNDLEPDSPINEQLRGRLPWLYFNTLTALFASWVVSNFEALIGQVAILAAFQSVVAGLGGNSASQNVAMIVRSVALGKTTVRQLWPVLLRQMLVGFLTGLAVGSVVGVGVSLWQKDPHLGLILGLAMLMNMVVAGIVGTVVPFLIIAFGKDPALASTVLVTATTDSMGFLIFLSLATIFLPYLE
jgi:magnesium transporter